MEDRASETSPHGECEATGWRAVIGRWRAVIGRWRAAAIRMLVGSFDRTRPRFRLVVNGLISVITNTPPILFLFVSTILGFVFVCLSLVVGVGSLHYNYKGLISKQVGFFFAPNWVVSFLAFFPLSLFFLISALHNIQRLIPELLERKMLVDGEGWPVDKKVIESDWSEFAARAGTWAVVLSLAAPVESLYEAYNASPQLRFGNSLAVAKKSAGFHEHDVDWSWGSTFTPNPVDGKAISPRLNWMFNFTVYLAGQAVAIAAFISFMVLLVGFSCLIYRYTLPGSQILLIPDIDDHDRHRGFEVFRDFVVRVLEAALCFYLAFFMTRLQRVYLNSESSSNIFDFLRDDLVFGFLQGFQGIVDLDKNKFMALLDPGPFSSFGEIVLLAVVFVLFLMILMLPIVILREAADQSRANLRKLIGDPTCDLNRFTKLSREECRKRSDAPPADPKGMLFYPVRYPSINQLVAICFFCLFAFIFYRLMIVVFGIVGANLIRRAIIVLRAWLKSMGDEGEPDQAGGVKEDILAL